MIKHTKRYISMGLILMATLLCPSLLRAQVSHGGKPIYNKHIAKGSTSPTLSLPAVDNEALLQEDLDERPGASPMRVSVAVAMDADVMQTAQALPQADGSTIYRMAVASPGAYFLSLSFDEYVLPEGGTLFFYDATGQFVIGSFNGQDAKRDGGFYTQAIPGDLCYIECHLPARTPANACKLHLSTVMHGYKDLFDGMHSMWEQSAKGALGSSSGRCHIDVACDAGKGWCNQIRSVVCYVLETSQYAYFCSGALINNTRNDKTPYFLSAHHCQDEGTVLRWTFYFNYQASSCNAQDGPINQSLTGATIRAKSNFDSGSDFLLLELDQAVPERYNAYYAGWDRSGENIASGCCIHHPGGDEKKISLTSSIAPVSGNMSNYLRADWNNRGITEGGSSGSPLFNRNGLIIGQLYGGNSSCSNTYGVDYFGRIDASWNGKGTKATRLKDWLDPDNSGVLTLSGYGNEDSLCTPATDYEVATGALHAYPNPTDGERFRIQVDDSGSATYYVYSMDGRLMKSGEMSLTPAEQSINLVGLRNGAYYVEVIRGDNRYGNTVIICR